MPYKKKAHSRTVLTPEIHATIVDALRMGAFKRHAAAAAGVPHTTLEQWLVSGQHGSEPYVQFWEDCERAIAEDALRNQSIITRASMGRIEGDWRAAAWNLERKHPKLYGRIAEQREPERERPYSPWKVNDAASPAGAVPTDN